MKKLFYFLSFILAVSFTSCELDNYEEPNINLTGTVKYGDRPIYVRNNQVVMHLYEEGWELSSSTYMNVQIAQDGTYSAGIYGGKDYRLVRVPNMGPWVSPTDADDIIIDNYDGRTVDVQVTPYYLLDNESITCSGRQVTGTCTITEVTPGMNIEKVGLYVGRNIIVDDTRNLGQGGYTEVNTGLAAGQTVTLNVDLSGFSTNSTNNSLPQTGFVYARMGLKIAGIDAMIFTEPVQVKFN